VATKEKNAAEERMAEVQAKLDKMQAEFDAAMAQKQVGHWAARGVLGLLGACTGPGLS
jgi:DNA-binding ferritin-like protein